MNENNYIIPANKLHKTCSPTIFDSIHLRISRNNYIPLGQKRVYEALDMATNVKSNGYNIFAMGETGIGKNRLISCYLNKKARIQAPLKDWIYVHNFSYPEKPIAIDFPGGKAKIFKHDMNKLFEDFRMLIPLIFESESYRKQLTNITNQYNKKHSDAIKRLQESALENKIGIIKMKDEFTVVPLDENNKPILSDNLSKISAKDKAQFLKHIKNFENKLEKILAASPMLERQKKIKLLNLNHKLIKKAILPLIKKLEAKWKNHKVHEYLENIFLHTIENFSLFLPSSMSEEVNSSALSALSVSKNLLAYEINIIIDNSKKINKKGLAPVVILDNPNYHRLFGKIEYKSQLGGLTTDLTLLRPGSLHEANGGYLVIDAKKIFEIPLLWESLKYTIKHKTIQFITQENTSTNSNNLKTLEPQPIPLDVKIILVGEPDIYYKLWHHDSEFSELFKMVADFDPEVDYNNDNALKYAEIIKNACHQDNLKNLTAEAYAKIVEIGAKIAGTQKFLTTNMTKILNVVKEANFLAKKRNSKYIEAVDLTMAYKLQKERVSKYNIYWEKDIKDKTILVSTKGKEVGQINGLSIVTINDFQFGQPQRITASVYKGHNGVMDIERNVKLSGAIHSKGVMILQAFLHSQFAQEHPMAFTASLVFEQSYGEIDGDSATCAETLALLSALSDIPLNQSYGITGSMDQKGRIQSIGGVNHKIEGFYNVCKIQGLDGSQGVVIPKINTKDLMLPQEIVAAVEQGLFNIYQIDEISDAIKIFMNFEEDNSDDQNALINDKLYNIIKRKWVDINDETIKLGNDL